VAGQHHFAFAQFSVVLKWAVKCAVVGDDGKSKMSEVPLNVLLRFATAA